MKRKIGFIGCYSHDVILMLTKALGSMGKRVLLRDCNSQHTLQVSVPMPEGVNKGETLFEYDGFLFTERSDDCGIPEECEIEIIDFGMGGEKEAVTGCSDLIVISDMLLHHIRRLQTTIIPREVVRACIMRDAYETVCSREPEVQSFLSSFQNKNIFFLPSDFRDVKNRYVCESLHEYNISKASAEMREVMYRLVGIFCPGYSEKEIRRRIRAGERRQYR